jgi:hypothetical protein
MLLCLVGTLGCLVKLYLGLSGTGIVKISGDASFHCKALRNMCAMMVALINLSLSFLVMRMYTWYLCALNRVIGFPILEIILELRLDLFGVVFDNLVDLGLVVVCVPVLRFYS